MGRPLSIGTRADTTLVAALDAEATAARITRSELIHRILRQWQDTRRPLAQRPILVALRAVYEVPHPGGVWRIEVAPGCAPVALGGVPPEAIRAVMEGVR